MSYVTEGTVWPEALALDDSVKNVISLFYQLADDNDPQAGPRMASEVFTPDGKFVAAGGSFQGKEEISRSRDNAPRMTKARRHEIRKVFVNDKQGHDLFLLGQAKLDFVNGKTVEAPFATHVVINARSSAAGSPRLESLEVFADSAPIANALKKD
ncbi:hypothetical protein PV11_07023 [Exophiala sideris]|uniref:SnoaL-like domain-containing protein n=1 Tax=Exophiala sideris TaxID=1016849 RepID=A0A0D1WWA8_9EURO|nr:hypothetical protein PV11_07023 [Exophiala sideris]